MVYLRWICSLRRLWVISFAVSATVLFTFIVQFLLHDDDFSLNKEPKIIDLDQLHINSETDLPGEHPIIVWWTPLTGERGNLRKCGQDTCYFTQQKEFYHHENTEAFIFYGTAFEPTDLPLPKLPGHVWALLHEESPKNNYLLCHEEALELFSYTSTFRQGSDFPLTLQHFDSIESLVATKHYVPFEEKEAIQKAKNLADVAFVNSDCDTPSDRDTFVKQLMKFIRVDSYGTCLHNKDLPENINSPVSGMNHDDFYKLLSEYKFVLSLENAVCRDYITEKLWRTLTVGAIPIYYGAPNILEWLPNNNSAILVDNFTDVESLSKYIRTVGMDKNLYESYLRHKIEGGISNKKLMDKVRKRKWGINNDFVKGNFIEHFECFVCNEISKPRTDKRANVNHYGCPAPHSPFRKLDESSNFWSELYYKAKFEAVALNSLALKNKNFTSDKYINLVLDLLKQEKESMLRAETWR